jgi:hypothetical protein
MRKKLPKEKFQILLSMTEANAFLLHSAIRQITEDYSIDDLVSMFCGDVPEFKILFGGKP